MNILRLLFVVSIAFGAYKFYQNGYTFGAPAIVTDDGKPRVVLFTGPNCGEHCERFRTAFQARGVTFEEIDVAGPDGEPLPNKYGVQAYPTTLIGDKRLQGSSIMPLTAALAEAFGEGVLTPAERTSMAGHFDGQGRPKVVLYGTAWCGYCAKQREYFAGNGVAFDDIDVERSHQGGLTYRAFNAGGYPLVFVGYRRFDGYHEADLMAAIKELKVSVQ